MLKGIDKLLTGELLKALCDMGHGDELVIADANFPAETVAKRLIRVPGVDGVRVAEAVLSVFPLDTYVDAPVSLMQVTPGDNVATPIWDEFAKIVEKHQPGTKIGQIERFQFYDTARRCYAVVSTGETALYANVILQKGVIK